MPPAAAVVKDLPATTLHSSTKPYEFHIGVIGGGIAGSTVAARFADIPGVQVTLFEAGSSLVNGPPVCHLHAGGNLYREISEQQCLDLLEECIYTVRCFPHTMNYRPTVITVPTCDPGNPEDILPRLIKVQERYRWLVAEDQRNRVLGDPEKYYKLYSHNELLALRSADLVDEPTTFDEWMVPVAKHLDLDQMKYPVVMVQELGWSILRMAAVFSLALGRSPNCNVLTNTRVSDIQEFSCSRRNCTNHGWLVRYSQKRNCTQVNHGTVQVDYLVNACGYQTGAIDDLLGVQQKRMVEFKAAYLANWGKSQGTNIKSSQWPEVIIHGIRGTPQGMAQLTPNQDGVFQLHGMTKDITLFNNGLAKSTETSSQPALGKSFQKRLNKGWDTEETRERTSKAIDFISKFLPEFANASPCSGPPLYGGQQIPGADASLRVAGVSFPAGRYARMEIVKGSSAPSAANAILEQCLSNQYIPLAWKRKLIAVDVDPATLVNEPPEVAFNNLSSLLYTDIVMESKRVARSRGLPVGLALPVGHYDQRKL